MNSNKKKILILGVGNYLLKDEGVGVHIAKQLMTMKLPSCVEVMDGGTIAYDLLPFIEGKDKLIVLDAIKANDKPGSLYRFSPHDINLLSSKKISLHQVELLDILNIAEITAHLPETIIFGVEPKEINFSLELSSEVKEVIPKVIELVLQEVQCTNYP
ncbi:MAG: HyaD/HybD family hydrogenase maturation endopeptidase [bacterium]